MIQFQENHFTLRREVEHGKSFLLNPRYDSQRYLKPKRF